MQNINMFTREHDFFFVDSLTNITEDRSSTQSKKILAQADIQAITHTQNAYVLESVL